MNYFQKIKVIQVAVVELIPTTCFVVVVVVVSSSSLDLSDQFSFPSFRLYRPCSEV